MVGCKFMAIQFSINFNVQNQTWLGDFKGRAPLPKITFSEILVAEYIGIVSFSIFKYF